MTRISNYISYKTMQVLITNPPCLRPKSQLNTFERNPVPMKKTTGI